MEAVFQIDILGSGGGHDLLSLIPALLHLHEHNFGVDINSLDVEVHFVPYDVDIAEIGLSKEPSFKVFNSKKKLEIRYVSEHLPFDVGYIRGKNILEPGGTTGCRRMEKFVRELRGVMSELGPTIRRKCDFDWELFLRLIDDRLKDFPKRDAELIAINARDQERFVD